MSNFDFDDSFVQDVVYWYKDHTSKNTMQKYSINSQQLNFILSTAGVQKHSRSEVMRLTSLQYFGVENISQSQQYADTIKNRTSYDKDRITEKRKITNMQKYGCEHVLQNQEILTKQKTTCIDRYGVDNFSKSSQFKDSLIQANQNKYGVDFTAQLPSVREKYRSTCIDRYGVDNYSKSQEFSNFIKDKSIDNLYNDEYKSVFYDKQKSIEFLQGDEWTIHKLSNYFGVTESSIECWLHRMELYDMIDHCKSHYENDILNLFPSFVSNSRKVLSNGKELDFFDKERNIAIEFNGDYWHSDKFKDKKYHLEKSLMCQEAGIRLIHIYEYEWNSERIRPIIISMINIALKGSSKIYARNCQIREITNKQAKQFNEANHLQGHRNAQVTYGLFYKGELVQLMSFSKTKWNRNLKGDNDWEIIRGCPGSNNIVVGGVSKLFKHFIKVHNPSSIFSYCDFNKFDGKSYEAIGMKFVGYTGPDKTWIIDGVGVKRNPRKYKQYKQRSQFVVWGSGSKKYLWENNNKQEAVCNEQR